ncbi:MAG TPA: portal protein, partial [bacterium]
FGIGRTTEITREEVKFHRFIVRQRQRFSELFNQLLVIQLSLKNVMTQGDFEKIQQTIVYEFQEDNHFSELKESEILQNRLANLTLIDPEPAFGKYFSKEWIVKNVLHMTEEEYEDILNQIDHEKSSGEIPEVDPMAMMGMGGPGGMPGGMPGQPMGPLPPPGMPTPLGLPKPSPFAPKVGGPPGSNGKGPPPGALKKKKPPAQLRAEKIIDDSNLLIEAIWNKING